MSDQNTHGASESEEIIDSVEEENQQDGEVEREPVEQVADTDVDAEEAQEEAPSDGEEAELEDESSASDWSEGSFPSSEDDAQVESAFPTPHSFGVEDDRSRSNGDDGVDGLPFDADHLWDPAENGEEFLGGSADSIVDDAQRDYYEYGDKMHTVRADVVDEAAAAPARGKHGRHGKAKPTRKERLAAMPEHQRKSRRQRRVLVFVLIVLIALLGAMAYWAYQAVTTISDINVQQGTSATTDVLQSSNNSNGKDASSGNSKVTDVPDLVGVLGLSQDEAIAKLGHGATITLTAPVSEEGNPVTANLTVMLTDEPADSKSGTPTVYLSVTEEGTVVRAGYTAATASLGYGDLSFSDAVSNEHVIEKTLNEAGLNVADGSVTLPDASQYTTYATDGTTRVFEKCSFDGTSTVGSATYNWSSVLSYDYTAANASGNLADTVRQITIYISAS